MLPPWVRCGFLNTEAGNKMEKLYNNILLEDDFNKKPSDPENVPYLKNPPAVIDVSVGRQLFVDDFLIEETNLSAVYHRPIQYEGNPILTDGAPWEQERSGACPKSGGVWFDEEENIFKMWYEGGWLHHMCYAESCDGIHWERPSLGVVPGTNIILPYDDSEIMKQIGARHGFLGDLTFLRPDSTTVFIDYDAPKAEKYKLFLRNPGGVAAAIVATSGDGIHFEKFQFTSEVGDRSTTFYNPFRKKWVYSIRSIETNENGWYRARRYRECDDFLGGAKWKAEEALPWLSCDEKDLPDPEIGMPPQLYNVDCVGYESIMLGMFQMMHGPENQACEETATPKVTGLIPMYSRDGYHFSRPSREIFIGSSKKEGAWDRGYVQSAGGVVMICGDELWLYYIGFRGDERFKKEYWITNGMYRNASTGLAKLRRDGFVSMHGEGTLLTRKLRFTGKEKMILNAKGKVTCEVLDENGALLGKTFFEGDKTGAELTFDNLSVRDLNDKVFRLQFTVKGHLYAFGFADASGDCGGARGAGLVK